MAGTFTNLLYHIVFSTKHRQSLITSALQPELYKYLGGIIRGEGGTLLEIGGTADHVHLVTMFKADVSVAEMLRLIKGNSSKWANQRPGAKTRFGWQTGYASQTWDRIRRTLRMGLTRRPTSPLRGSMEIPIFSTWG